MNQETVELRASDFAVPPDAPRWQGRALIVGVVGIAFCVAGAIFDMQDFLRGYLVAFMFWTGLSLGCLGLLLLQYLSGGLWGLSIRRILEASTKCLWVTAAAFIPLWIFKSHLYAWMTDPSLTLRNGWYLHVGGLGGWTARAILYFAIWLGLQFILNKRGDLQDSLLTVQPRFQGLSGLGLVLYSLTLAFASVDWVMSLDPHWGSTIYGLIFLAGQGLSALCFSIIVLTVLTRYSPYREIIKPMQFHDLGKLTFAFVMLFAYFSFSQWLIIWAGNLPEEIGWFLHRIRGAWGVVILGIVLLHFALPFSMLLSRERKRAGKRLIGLAILLMCMRMVDIYWYVIPNFPDARLFSIWYLAAPMGLGGLWLTFFFHNFRKRPILPLYEPQVPSLLHQGSGHGH